MRRGISGQAVEGKEGPGDAYGSRVSFSQQFELTLKNTKSYL